jgi:predicted secreted protein
MELDLKKVENCSRILGSILMHTSTRLAVWTMMKFATSRSGDTAENVDSGSYQASRSISEHNVYQISSISSYARRTINWPP